MKPLLFLTLAGLAFGQQPRIQNAKLDTRNASPTLESAFRMILQTQNEPAWIGYSVPRAPRDNGGYEDSWWGCSLENGAPARIIRDINTPVPLEGPANMLILFRVAEQKVQRIRTMAPDCLLDAGGLPFFWFNNVRPAESVQLFEGFFKANSPTSIYAIAMTRDPEADAALNRLVDASQPESVRRKAASWVGFDTLVNLLKNDPSDKVRQQVVSSLARRKEPGAIPTVIRAAREDKSDKVRRQAMNALARSKDPAAVRFFEEVLVK
jgi:hypothetical protein